MLSISESSANGNTPSADEIAAAMLAATEAAVSTWADLAKVLGPIRWEWPGWVARGFMIVCAGEPGTGKSSLLLRIGDCYLTGRCWPDGTPFEGEPGAVLWCESEAGQALNLDRAKSWGLPLERILTPLPDPLADIQLDNPEHRKAIAQTALRGDVRLIIVDSLRGAHRRDENSSETIGMVSFLAELARDTGKPLMLSHHLRKRSLFDTEDGGISLDRLRGSSAIIQPARLIWAVDTPDPNTEVRRLSVIKSNLGPKPDALGLTVDESGVTFCGAPQAPQKETITDKAIDLLVALLGDQPRKAEDIENEFKRAGLSWRSAERAKEKLRIVSRKQGTAWFWSLPAKTQ